MAIPESVDAETAPPADDEALLARTYETIAWGFVNPETLDEDAFTQRLSTLLPAIATRIDRQAAEHLAAFLDAFDEIDPTQYVETLELAPDCPLYLGHYAFDEPATCHDIADADRNQYMVELAGIYEHYGYELDAELPDFVPAMAEFMGLTASSRSEPLRTEFIERFLELLPDMQERFGRVGTPYRHLLVGLERVASADIEGSMDSVTSDTGGDP